MKTLIINLLTILPFTCAFGQTDFVGETNPNPKLFHLNQKIDSLFKVDRSIDFEFRLWTQASMTSYKSVFILTLKDSVWNARFFEGAGSQKGKFSEIGLHQGRLKDLWQRLVANQVLTLPTQDSLKSRMKIFIADTSYALDPEDTYKRVLVTDGTTYNFELIAKNKRRFYEYHCPQSHSRNYPNVEELYRAFAIIVLIRKHLNLNLSVC